MYRSYLIPETQGIFCLKSARFVDQIGISPGTFSAGGDSGSLIVTEDGNYPVGLLFAGSSTRTIANPIGFVLSRFNVAIDGGAEPPPTTPPDMPSNLTAEVVSSNQINLAWIDNAIDEDGFRIERCQGLGCANFAQIATVGANTTSYSDTGLSASTTYAYRVLAFNAAGDSEYSNYAEATTLDAPALPPGAPSNLAAKAVSSSQINLTWIDNANNEDGFEIQRCTGSKCTDFATITTVGPNVTSYSNTGLSRSTTYRYRVRAYNTSGDSAYSNIAKATTRR